MRILILAPAYNPHMGGAETYARVLAEGLSSMGDSVAVLTDGTRIAKETANEGGVEVFRLTSFNRELEDVSKLLWEQMAFSLCKEVQEISAQFRPDVIIANSNDTASIGRMLGDTLGVPVVGSFHEQEPEVGPLGEGRARLVYSRLGLQGILAGSRFYAEKAINYGAPASHVHLIPHGVDTGLFEPSELNTRCDNRFRLVLSGRLAPRKQQLMMIDVLRALRHEHQVDAELVLAGRAHSSSMEYLDAIRTKISLNSLENDVLLLQDLGLRDMPHIYRDSDVVVQPSTAEGLGLAVLEAMACGRPVVVSDVSGLREIVQDTQIGIRVDPTNFEEWVEVLLFLYKNRTVREKLGTNARRKVLLEFSNTRMLADTRQVLTGIVKSWSYFKRGISK